MPAADPFANIPDADDDEYVGTGLETTAERERRTATTGKDEPGWRAGDCSSGYG